MTQNISNLCVKCRVAFQSWGDYHAHVTSNACRPKIMPLNTSGRTKAQIVQAWEDANKGALIQ